MIKRCSFTKSKTNATCSHVNRGLRYQRMHLQIRL